MSTPDRPQTSDPALSFTFATPPRAHIASGRALLPRAHRTAEIPEEEAFAGLTALGPVPSERKARDWALVLQSMSVWHIIRRSYAGWMVLVHDGDYEKASKAVDRYEDENRDWPPRQARERARHAPSSVAPLLFAALVAFFFVTGPVSMNSRFFQRGTAVTDLILTSEPWRAVTALTLHADSVHVFGNVISGTIFASAVYRRLGPGGGTLAIVASGILGNLANAVWHHATGNGGHASIGASTAVFGAVGLLAATQMTLSRPDAPNAKERRGWLDLVAPLVGGLALLGALGASPNADLGAHLFGFLAGALIGLGASWPLRHSAVTVDLGGGSAGRAVQIGRGAPRWWIQLTLGAIAIAIVALSWQLAFFYR